VQRCIETHDILASSDLGNATTGALRVPTALSIDQAQTGTLTVALGYSSGEVGIFELERKADGLEQALNRESCADRLTCCWSNHSHYRFVHRYTHTVCGSQPLTAVALTSPYLFVMDSLRTLSLYHLPSRGQVADPLHTLELLSSLRSDTARPPLCLSVRVLSTGLVASVAFAVPTYLSGWSVRLQELRLSLSGALVESRLASPIRRSFVPMVRNGCLESSPSQNNVHDSSASMTKPTSMSYSHPYLLSAYADNTMNLHLINSSDTALTIGDGQRLWGHTSSVSDVQVGDRGKAVSISTVGEVLIWELEGISKRRLGLGDHGVKVRPKRAACEKGSAPVNGLHGVGFDSERIILLREDIDGKQKLVIYSFG
jgi:hypothetical protein